MTTQPFNSSIDHYPFGMVMPERSYISGGGYRFGFQGQEKDLEINQDGNSMTALFWQYDARLGRRWNVDPLGRKWESVYAVLGNNPISNVDPLGDIWDPANEEKSETNAQEQESYTNSLISKINSEVKKLNKKKTRLSNKKVNKRRKSKIEKINSRLKKLGTAKKHFEETIATIQRMRDDPDQKFSLVKSSNQRTHGDGDVIVVNYTNTDDMAHEIRHIRQWYRRETSIFKYGQQAGFLHDINDEIDAFKVQVSYQMFDPYSPAVEYSEINREFLGNLKKTYLNLPTENLTVSSSIEQLKSAHGQRLTPEYLNQGQDLYHLKGYEQLKSIHDGSNEKKVQDFIRMFRRYQLIR